MNMKKNYSNLSRLTLNYDMTFLILILSSLYEVEDRTEKKRCITHPIEKQLIIQNEITDYAAAMNIMLAYYNCKDNWIDEKDFKSLVFSKLINHNFDKTVKLYEEKQKFIKKSLDNLQELEKKNCDNIDDVSNEFGYLMGELMVYKNDNWEKILRNVGFFLGKYIYILDAYLDVETDKKNNSYNPFLNIKFNKEQNIDSFANDAMLLNLSFLHQEIDKLPLIKDKGIIDNIILSGIMSKLKKKANNEEKPNERSI
ncbi:hypothetical protein JYG23_08245 [Sedimentibacter sp. zth1]|nr:hypothetical protein JYG23_08245 [Sedimentibacter sp. zth1]